MAKGISKGQVALGILIVAIFGAVMALYLLKPDMIPSENREWSMLIGALISNFSIVIGFYFGSSKSSQDKNNLLTGLTKPQP